MSAAYLAWHVFLPLGLVGALASWKPRSRLPWIAAVALVAAYLFHQSKVGGWHHLAMDLPWLWWGLFLAASLFSSWRMGGQPLKPTGGLEWAATAVFTLGAGLLVTMFVVSVPPASKYEDEPVALGFPLGPGEFVVTQGGNWPILNAHNGDKTMRYAVDFVALNSRSAHADGFMPEVNDAFAIYGAPVRAPCKGRALAVHDGADNNVPGTPGRDVPPGNNLTIHCEKEDVTVAFLHLEKNSITAKAGKRVKKGEEVASVGNSGTSAYPHLHMHAVRGKVEGDDVILNAEPVPMTFGGRFLLRNDQVNVR